MPCCNPKPAATDDGNEVAVRKNGNLYLRSWNGHGETWVEFHFTLTHQDLLCHRIGHSKGAIPRQAMRLYDAALSAAPALPESRLSNQDKGIERYPFQVSAGGQAWVLSGADVDDTMAWCAALQQVGVSGSQCAEPKPVPAQSRMRRSLAVVSNNLTSVTRGRTRKSSAFLFTNLFTERPPPQHTLSPQDIAIASLAPPSPARAAIRPGAATLAAVPEKEIEPNSAGPLPRAPTASPSSSSSASPATPPPPSATMTPASTVAGALPPADVPTPALAAGGLAAAGPAPKLATPRAAGGRSAIPAAPAYVPSKQPAGPSIDARLQAAVKEQQAAAEREAAAATKSPFLRPAEAWGGVRWSPELQGGAAAAPRAEAAENKGERHSRRERSHDDGGGGGEGRSGRRRRSVQKPAQGDDEGGGGASHARHSHGHHHRHSHGHGHGHSHGQSHGHSERKEEHGVVGGERRSERKGERRSRREQNDGGHSGHHHHSGDGRRSPHQGGDRRRKNRENRERDW